MGSDNAFVGPDAATLEAVWWIEVWVSEAAERRRRFTQMTDRAASEIDGWHLNGNCEFGSMVLLVKNDRSERGNAVRLNL